MRRRVLLISAAAACVVAPVAMAGTASAPDVTELIPQAIKKIQKAKDGAFEKAVMLEAQGLPSGDGTVGDASGITRWRFVADNQKTKGSKFLSVYVDWEASEGFAKVKGVKSPFLEDRRMKSPPAMTLTEAVERLKAAGFTDPFANVTLRRPLLQDGATPPLYIFGFEGNSYVAVNSKSGDVAPF